MFELTRQNVQLHCQAGSKEEAIREVGRILVSGGYIASGYVESMMQREQQANTYLGNGIAIPHGMQKDRDLIYRTGVAVVQLRQDVEWNPGQSVRLVAGIAAKSDEHLSLLANLSDILDDPAMAQRLAETNEAAEIISGLNRRRDGEEASAAPAAELAGAQYVEVVMASSGGLHARPATAFIDVANQFAADIQVQFNGKSANGKALASLLKLGVESGAMVRIAAAGPDASAALWALQEAVESGLGDNEQEAALTVEGPKWTPQSNGRAITGVSAAPGLAMGRLFQFRASHIVVTDTARDADTEKQRLKQALETARAQIEDIYQAVKTRAGRSEAAIFRAHQALLNDCELYQDVCTLLDVGHSAGWAWQQVIETRVTSLQQVHNERLAARATDFHDVGQRVLRVLTGTEQSEGQLPAEPVILVADELTPSDTARLDPKRVLGFCTAGGGPTSHTAIIARSLDIPAVVGAGAAILEVTDGITCILDGSTGQLYVEPSEADLESGREFQKDMERRRDAEYETRYQPALLTDGHRVEVVANIAKAAEAAEAVNAGAEGVGLLRTEFLFLERDTPPSEEEQFVAYLEMVRALNGLPLVIRTLDIGGDKVVPYLSLPKEDNPFLGVRGIRLCLRKPELFIPQLRAIYRVSTLGPVKIMFPMVATLEELRAAKQAAEQVRQELGAAPVEIGIMVEVPSTVMMAAEFAQEVDFFSVGTNDLTQYVLATDRMHPALAKNVDSLHPAVLRMIDQTVRAAQAAGKWVGVCGGIAGDPRGALILAGLGVTELSMSVPSVAAVKARLRQESLVRVQALARKALACKTADEVRELSLG